MNFKYFVKPFKRTRPVPIDAHFIIADIAGVDTYIPRELRYEGMVCYTLNEKSYYHMDQNLNPIPFGGGGGGDSRMTVVKWDVRDSNNYLDYSELFYTLRAYPAGSVIRVEPLGVDFLVQSSPDGNTVTMDPNTAEIHFELYDVGESFGVEIESLLVWATLPENADVLADKIMNGETVTPNEGKVFRVTDGRITDYIPEITEVNKFYQGRFYKNGTNLYICNGNSTSSDSLILISGSGGGGGAESIILWADTQLVVSDSITTPYINLRSDTKNVLPTGTIGRVIYELYGVVRESSQALTIVHPTFVCHVPENENSSIIVQSRYNVTMDLIGVYHG